MRGMKALAAAVALSLGAASATAMLPAVAFAQVPLQTQLQNAVNALGANPTLEQVLAAVMPILNMSGATPQQKKNAVDALANTTGDPDVAAAISGLSKGLAVIIATPPGTSTQQLNQNIETGIVPYTAPEQRAAYELMRNGGFGQQFQSAANSFSSGGNNGGGNAGGGNAGGGNNGNGLNGNGTGSGGGSNDI